MQFPKLCVGCLISSVSGQLIFTPLFILSTSQDGQHKADQGNDSASPFNEQAHFFLFSSIFFSKVPSPAGHSEKLSESNEMSVLSHFKQLSANHRKTRKQRLSERKAGGI